MFSPSPAPMFKYTGVEGHVIVLLVIVDVYRRAPLVVASLPGPIHTRSLWATAQPPLGILASGTKPVDGSQEPPGLVELGGATSHALSRACVMAEAANVSVISSHDVPFQ